DFLTKEAAACTPLLLALIWLFMDGGWRTEDDGRRRTADDRRRTTEARQSRLPSVVGRRSSAFRTPAVGRRLRRAAAALGIPAALAGGYLLFHAALVRNVYPSPAGLYQFVGSVEAAGDLLFALNHALFSALDNPLLLGRAPVLHQGLGWLVRHLSLAPLLVAAAAAWRRDRTVLFGLGWFV